MFRLAALLLALLCAAASLAQSGSYANRAEALKALSAAEPEQAIDAASPAWLGRCSGRERVRESGLWNNNHVDEAYDSGNLDIVERAVRVTVPLT